MRLFFVLTAAASLVVISCERQEFEGPDGTKQLHQHHGAGGSHDGKHDEKHGGEPHETAPAAGHGAKPAH